MRKGSGRPGKSTVLSGKIGKTTLLDFTLLSPHNIIRSQNCIVRILLALSSNRSPLSILWRGARGEVSVGTGPRAGPVRANLVFALLPLIRGGIKGGVKLRKIRVVCAA